MNKVERWWHWRLFCPCGWNEENEYGPSTASFFSSKICTECGRSYETWELTKGRWSKDWDSNAPWTREDWEVWVDPDRPKEPENISFTDPLTMWLIRVVKSMRRFLK